MMKGLSFFYFLCLHFCASLYGGDPSGGICLTMIVKNDQEVILPCLLSVKDLVDCISIYDGGSTDRTLRIVEEFLEDSGIPGKIHRALRRQSDERIRLQTIRSAQSLLKSNGFSLEKSYLFVLDPSYKVDISSSFRKESLSALSYLLPELSPHLHRYRAHLFRADGSWNAEDISYDLDSYKSPAGSVKNGDIRILEHDGGFDSKLHRLDQALEENPNSSRMFFDLAQVQKNLKQYEEAIASYKECIRKGGPLEEIWFSKYMIGMCYEEMDHWDLALSWYLDAFQTDSSRPESLRKISSHYRYYGQNDLSHIFAKYGSLLHGDSDKEFVDPSYFDYQFEEDLSIVSYYTQFRKDGLIAASDLMLRREAPWWVKDLASRNILFYVQNLPKARYEKIDIELPFITPFSQERFHPMNPSLCKTKEGYQVICRSVNYTQTGAKIFNTIDTEGIYRTRNFLLSYDVDFQLISQVEIRESLYREKNRPMSIVQGLEDCRIFEYDNSYWFTCTTRDGNPSGVPQIVLCRIGDDSFGDVVEVEEFISLLGPDLNRCEKNWLPFVKDSSIQMIYSSDPFVIYKPDLNTGKCEKTLEYQPLFDFSRFRGSAAPIVVQDGYLMLVHEVSFLSDSSRVYLHRFVYLDHDFVVKKVSLPFTFTHQGVEFCCSMTLDHSEKELVMAVGSEDAEAMFCFIHLDDVLSLLQPLEGHD
jgi:tetratricopeptide (TPR) repeat protein